MKKINRIEDIPNFSSDAEAAEFWKTHRLGPDLLAQMKRWDELGEDDPLPPPRAPRES